MMLRDGKEKGPGGEGLQMKCALNRNGNCPADVPDEGYPRSSKQREERKYRVVKKNEFREY